jgi:signal transduction histidine kinase
MDIQSSFSGRYWHAPWLRYVLAAIAVLVSSLICAVLDPYVGNQVAFVLLLPAIAFSAWYCGAGPTLLALAMSLAESFFGFLPKFHAFVFPDTAQSIAILAFLLSSVSILVMGEARRRQNEAMHRSQGELEERVRARTADLDVVNRNLRELSARLMQLQDDERRRIARELHDSVGQMLAALSMNLASVRNDVERLAQTAATLTDSESLVQDMSTEVRTISHLLHPPLLDEAGISSALRWYVEGFSQRSKISVDLDLPDGFGRLPSELETAVFRVVQESLTNIHRHSGSEVATIRIRRRDRQVLVQVEDRGRGIPLEKQEELATHGTVGVGIRGMRERLRQLGGTLEIQSSGSGTLVTVLLPIPEKSLGEPVRLPDSSTTAAA